jgi:hypothetical protein
MHRSRRSLPAADALLRSLAALCAPKGLMKERPMRWVLSSLMVLALAPPALSAVRRCNHVMRRLLPAFGLMGGLASPAFAGDFDLPILRGSDPVIMPVAPPTFRVVPPAPIYRWGGVYGGVQGGYSGSAINLGTAQAPIAFILRETVTVPIALHLDWLLPKLPDNFRVQRSLLAAGIIATCALPLIYMQTVPALGFPQVLSEQDVLYLQTNLPHARLLNHWNYGGILIFRTRGAIPVFVDGRAATVYPDALLRDYFSLVQREINESAWDAVLEKYQVDTVLWVKGHEELRRFLVGKRGWKEAYAGSYASIYVKP